MELPMVVMVVILTGVDIPIMADTPFMVLLLMVDIKLVDIFKATVTLNRNIMADIPIKLPAMHPNYYNFGQPNYGGYQGYGYSQPQYSYRQPNYNQPYNYGGLSGYYMNNNNLPYQYFGDPYTQQNPLYNPYGVFTGDWEDWSYLPSRYKNADLILDENDNDDDFTVDVGDSIAVILPSQISPGSGGYEWAFDDDDFDDDIISHNNTSEWVSGYQFWYFEAEEAGTTTIKFGNVSWLSSSGIGEDVFEVEIIVED